MNLALYCNPVRGGWTPADKATWGGSEESLTYFAEAFARRGHAVTVFYDGEPLEQAGVQYRNRSEAKPGFDALLAFKCPEAGHLRLAPLQVLWEVEERPFDPDPFHLIAPCSDYLKRYIAAAVPRAIEKLRTVPLGFEPREFPANPPPREPNLVLHTASPDRGLLTLLDLWPAVLKARPDTKLLVTHGWDLFEKYGGSPYLRRELETRLLSLPGNSVTMRRLSAEDMAAAYFRAAVWAYWCDGGEQFCLSAVKAQVAGAMPVVKPWGALHDTVWSGRKVSSREDFVSALLDSLAHPETPSTDSPWCRTWDSLAEEWEELLSTPQNAAVSSYVRLTPEAPPFARPAGWQAGPALFQFVGDFVRETQPQRLWLDPSLGLPGGNVGLPSEADAVVLGWTLEDAPQGPRDLMTAMGLQPGTAVLALASCGTWRAGVRRRALTRRDLAETFHQLPDVNLGCLALDGIGNGILSAKFRYVPERIGNRDLGRVLKYAAPLEAVSVCMIVRNNEDTLLKTLRSVQPIADEYCIIDTGSTDRTPQLVEDFAREAGVDVRYDHGFSPRHCWDCGTEHAIGEMAFGHRFAGFETPRNQSIALARGGAVLWIDSDEIMLHPERLTKYLRFGVFKGYGIPQDHHSCDPPEASKRDLPVRLFKLVRERPPQMIAYGPNQWPTFDPGTTTRFAGIVHEHPGHVPDYAEGLGPCILISDVWISHPGYLTEEIRRHRFVRNWPLMVADRQKYPMRRLGMFLHGLRDLSHQMRYCDEHAQPDKAVELAEEVWREFTQNFVDKPETFAADAWMYAATAGARLSRGWQFELAFLASKPELGPDEKFEVRFGGRLEDPEQLVTALRSRISDVSRWSGSYV